MAGSVVGTELQIVTGGNYTAESGSDRIVRFAIMTEATDSNGRAITAATFGSENLIEYTSSAIDNTNARMTGAFYYILEADIPAGSNAVTITWDDTVITTTIYCLTMENMEQVSPETGVDSLEYVSATAMSVVVPTVDGGVSSVVIGNNSSGTSSQTFDATWTEAGKHAESSAYLANAGYKLNTGATEDFDYASAFAKSGTLIGVGFKGAASGPTVTGPATGTQGTELDAVVTDGTDITEFSLVSGTFSRVQTNSDTVTATVFPYEPTSGEDVAVATGVTTLGIPLKADIIDTSTPYTWVQRVTDGVTPSTAAFTPSIESARQVVQSTIAEADTTSGQSMYGSDLMAAPEDGIQLTLPKVVNGVTIVVDVTGNVTVDAGELAAAGGSIPMVAGYFFPSTKSWEDLAVTLTEGGIATTGIPAEDGTAAPDHFNNSLPYNSDSELAIDSTSAIDTVSNGLPYTAAGRIAVSIDAAVTRVETGTPFDTNDKVAMGNDNTSRVEGGTPFTADGQIAVSL
jgi:hypothetical protein